MMKRLLAVLLCALLLFGSAIPVFAENATEAGDVPSSLVADGLRFSALGTYPVTKTYRETPHTLEAVICVPKALSARAGVILSNKPAEGGEAYLAMEVFQNGVPRLSYKDEAGVQYDFRFKETDVRADGWVHLAIVHDEVKGEVRCYLDGVLSETLREDRAGKAFSAYNAEIEKNPFLIGGDATEGNDYYFKGAIKSLVLFESVRSEAEIAADAKGVDPAAPTLLALYDMTGLTGSEDIPDRSPYLAHADCQREWFDEETAAYTGEYDFSLAVVGDTQNLVWREAAGQPKYQGATAGLYSWIVDRVESKKIQYVIGLGDIVDNDFDSEWEVAKSAIMQMDGVVPYSLIRGQGHDTATKLNRYFADHTPFTENLGGTFKEGSVANSWQSFSFGGVDYLIFGFDFGAPDDVLAWADGVVAAHPNHRIIVTTHAYLGSDGSTLDRGEVGNPTGYDDDVKYNEDPEKYVPDGRDSDAEFNDGRAIWEKFASKHKNVFMVISGHEIVEDIVINQRQGQNGNTVTEILIDAQGMDDAYETYDGGVGMVSMFYFDQTNHRVAIEYYSTVQKAYRRLNIVDLDHKHAFEEVLVPSTCKDRGFRARVCECGKETNRYELLLSTVHTYDSDADATCNLCGKTRVIEQETESESLSESLTESTAAPLPETGGVTEESAPTAQESADATATGAEDRQDADGEDASVWIVVGACALAAVLLVGGAVLVLGLVRKRK